MVLVVLAVIVATGSYWRWDQAERAIRLDRALPVGGVLPRLVAVGATVVGLGVLVLVLVGV